MPGLQPDRRRRLGELDIDEVEELMLQIGRDLKEPLPPPALERLHVAPLKWTLECYECTKFLSCCFPSGSLLWRR